MTNLITLCHETAFFKLSWITTDERINLELEDLGFKFGMEKFVRDGLEVDKRNIEVTMDGRGRAEVGHLILNDHLNIGIPIQNDCRWFKK